MESDDTEYQCSECGTEVQSDTKICPNCGASLEEAPEEDDFVEVLISSEPSTISTIQSLLQENNIEYSINDNAMGNVWGPSFTQAPRLLVSKEQADAVKEIISNLEEEEIEILDTEVFNKASSEKEDKKEQIKGVEGWLLVFCMTLMLGPLAYLFYDITAYSEIKDQVNWIPLKDTILIIDLILTIIISCLGVYAGWSLWKISSNAISITRLYLNSILAYSLFFLFLITIIFTVSKIPFNTISQNIYGVVVKDTISSLAYVIIWKLYLKNSERVKNTFSLGAGSAIQQ